jgi:hypothetical protein
MNCHYARVGIRHCVKALLIVASLPAVLAAEPRDVSGFTHIEEGGFPLNVNPTIVAADQAEIGDSDMVMGVVINGEARAYPLNYMNGPYNEIVNDQLGGVPITPSW